MPKPTTVNYNSEPTDDPSIDVFGPNGEIYELYYLAQDTWMLIVDNDGGEIRVIKHVQLSDPFFYGR